MRKRLLLLSSFYRWGHWGLCELHKTTLLRKLLFKSLATFPLSDIPQLAQKRVWVGDAVGEGEGTHWWRRLRVEASEPSHQLSSWWWKRVGLAGVQGTCRTQPVGLSSSALESTPQIWHSLPGTIHRGFWVYSYCFKWVCFLRDRDVFCSLTCI